MAPYIGTATSRVDGFAKVTGAAKYAAEFNAPGLVYGSVVTSTIAKGRIARIDASAAMRSRGRDRRAHAREPARTWPTNDQAYKDDMAPAGSPFRPLYDDKVRFNGQPIALVVAETSEIARFAASLVRVEYETEVHVTDVSRARCRDARSASADPVEAMFTPPKTRGGPRRRSPPRRCAMTANITFRSSITTRWSFTPRPSVYEANGTLTVYDKTQGVQNVQRYLCGVFGMKPEDVRVMSPFVGGAFGVRPAPAV